MTIGSSRPGIVVSGANGTLTADGTEQTLFTTDDPAGVVVVYTNVDNMQGGDTTEFRTYIRMVSGGPWILVDFDDYTGADGGLLNGELIVDEASPLTLHGVKMTVEQSAGVNRDYDWSRIEWAF